LDCEGEECNIYSEESFPHCTIKARMYSKTDKPAISIAPKWILVSLFILVIILYLFYSRVQSENTPPIPPQNIRPVLKAPTSILIESMISPHLKYCSRNPFLAQHSKEEVIAYEKHYFEWWQTRYEKLFNLLTDYYYNPGVNIENPAAENYDNLNAHRAGDGLLEIIYDVTLPFPCPSGLKAWGASAGTAKILCGLASVGQSEPCVVYSLGSRNTFDFEESVSRDTNCQIYTFDCTSEPPPNKIARVQFEKFCFGPPNNNGERNLQLRIFPVVNTPPNWQSKETIPFLKSMKMHSYYSVAADHLKHDHVSVLKMDIESGEYSVLVDLFNPQNEKYNNNLLPHQISLEIHWWNRGIAHAMLNLEMFNTLYFNGYRLLSHEKQLDSACFELTWIRVFC
jgi:hypothetical protein